jgi:thymidine phosphorylase
MAMAKATAKTRSLATKSLTQLRAPLAENLSAQGADLAKLFGLASRIGRARRYDVLAPEEGFLRIKLGELRDILVESQTGRVTQRRPFPDPVGIVFSRQVGEFVAKGEPLATIRCARTVWPHVRGRLQRAWEVTESPGQADGFEEVSDG